MSVTWQNVYDDGIGTEWPSIGGAEFGREGALTFIRVEQRWNGHWLRTPVGMRADQTSHVWTPQSWVCQPMPNGVHVFHLPVSMTELEPRHD